MAHIEQINSVGVIGWHPHTSDVGYLRGGVVRAVDGMLADGFRAFLCSVGSDFSIMAIDYLIECKERHPDLRIVVVAAGDLSSQLARLPAEIRLGIDLVEALPMGRLIEDPLCVDEYINESSSALILYFDHFCSRQCRYVNAALHAERAINIIWNKSHHDR